MKTKYYKTNPKHLFWFNENNVEKIKPIGGGLNMWESINLTTLKREGNIIRGYLLHDGAKKATESDFINALKKCKNE